MVVARIAIILVTAVAVGGCGPGSDQTPSSTAPTARAAAAGPSGLLFVDTPEAVHVLDPASGEQIWQDGYETAAPAFARVFQVRRGRLATLDGATGSEVAAMGLPAGLSPRVASASGDSLAFTEGKVGGSLYEPSGRTSTTVVVVRPADNDVRRYRLKGDFEPEAFSDDDNELFLIEHLTDERYRVRMMRLRSGRILPVGRLTKVAPDSMRGTGRVQVYSPDGDVLYTLYTRQPPNDTHRPLSRIRKGNVHAFVHVLNLREGWAHCVDLPMPFGIGRRPADVLAVSPDGGLLYAGDGRRAALVDTGKLKTVTMSRVDAFERGSALASVGWDGRVYFGAGASVSVIEGQTLRKFEEFDMSGTVRAIAVSSDGRELFVGLKDRVAVVDAVTGELLRTLPVTGATRIHFGEAAS